MKRHMIFLWGPSAGSMKTTVATLLQEAKRAQRLRGDGLYFGTEHAPIVHGMHNWEHPDSFDLKGLSHLVKALKAGVAYVDIPTYSRGSHSRTGVEKFEPHERIGRRIVLDSIFGANEALVRYADFKVFLDAPDELILERRRLRQGKAYTDEYHEKIMLPSVREMRPIWRERADLVVPINASTTSGDIAAQLGEEIEQRFPLE